MSKTYSPSAGLWSLTRPSSNGVIKITADCNDSISYTTQTVEIKVKSTGEIVYSPTGDPALDTTLIKCPI